MTARRSETIVSPSLQCVDHFLQALAEAPEVQAVDEAVVDLGRIAELEPLPAADVFAPGEARDRVVGVKVALVGERAEVQPGQAGEEDQVVSLLAQVDEIRLRRAFLPL